MKIKATVAMLSLALLAGCGSEDDKDEKKLSSPIYNLSQISVKCYLNHTEDRNDTGAGHIIPTESSLYIYTSSDIRRSNQCSPEGTDFPLFLVNDNLLSVLMYQQDIEEDLYTFGYLNPDHATSAAGIDFSDDLWPKFISVEGTNAQGEYIIEINLEENTRQFIQNEVHGPKELYTLEQAKDEFPNMMQQHAAMSLFQLANGQEPSL